MAFDRRALLQKPMADPVRLQKSLQKFGIPRPLRDTIVVGTKNVLAPGEEARRRRQISQLALPNSTDIENFKRTGSGILAAEHVCEAGPAAAALRRFYQQLHEAGRVCKPADHRKADFLVCLAANEEIMADEAVRRFVLSDELIGLAGHYFGQVPILSRADLCWSPPNKSKAESQLYHYDGEDKSQLKIVLNVVDVDENTGPFTFISADASEKIGKTRRHSARWDDDAVENTVGLDAVTRVMGRAGTVGAVDTSRCLHYGSRGNTRERLILMLQFTRFLAPKANLPNWSLRAMGVCEDGLDQTRKMVLNVA